jgi:hypothetical protein
MYTTMFNVLDNSRANKFTSVLDRKQIFERVPVLIY